MNSALFATSQVSNSAWAAARSAAASGVTLVVVPALLVLEGWVCSAAPSAAGAFAACGAAIGAVAAAARSALPQSFPTASSPSRRLRVR